MSTKFAHIPAVIRRCECGKPHKDGEYVVRFFHRCNRREWACRLCPHYPTLDAAIAGSEVRRSILDFVRFGKAS